jgi:hypothetical protein
MEINDLRVAVTVVSLVAFLLIVWRVYRRRAKDEVESWGIVPFMDSDSSLASVEVRRAPNSLSTPRGGRT